MTAPRPGDITALLQAWTKGDERALESLIPFVESELRRIARVQMSRERRGHTLQPTALVNEVFLRLVDAQEIGWADRAHFYAISARLMRRVLVDHARAHGYQKRGGGAQRVTLDEHVGVTPPIGVDLLALHDALTKLSLLDERKGRLIELRYFGGLTVGEAAAVLGVSIDTLKRDWRLAKLWLLNELG